MLKQMQLQWLYCFVFLRNKVIPGKFSSYRVYPGVPSCGQVSDAAFNVSMFFWPCIIVQTFSSYQLNAHFLYSITIYILHYNPQHVSSSTLLIFRRTKCIITASGIVTLEIGERSYSNNIISLKQKLLSTTLFQPLLRLPEPFYSHILNQCVNASISVTTCMWIIIWSKNIHIYIFTYDSVHCMVYACSLSFSTQDECAQFCVWCLCGL